MILFISLYELIVPLRCYNDVDNSNIHVYNIQYAGIGLVFDHNILYNRIIFFYTRAVYEIFTHDSMRLIAPTPAVHLNHALLRRPNRSPVQTI